MTSGALRYTAQASADRMLSELTAPMQSSRLMSRKMYTIGWRSHSAARSGRGDLSSGRGVFGDAAFSVLKKTSSRFGSAALKPSPGRCR